MNALNLYLQMLRVTVRAQMAYRANFIMFTIGNLIASGIEFLGVWAFFSRFGTLNQWSLWQVGVFYGIGNIAYAITEAWMRGFDTFHHMVRGGDFDRLLVRPRSAALQVLGREFQVLRVGRLMQGIAVLWISLAQLNLAWNTTHWLLLVAAILGGSLTFSGLIVLQATSCFFTIESVEVFNSFTYGGVYATQYPIDIYKNWLGKLFTFVIPLAAMNYFPCSYLLNLHYVPTYLSFISPLIGAGFFGITWFAWRYGVRHYRSTGS